MIFRVFVNLFNRYAKSKILFITIINIAISIYCVLLISEELENTGRFLIKFLEYTTQLCGADMIKFCPQRPYLEDVLSTV